jgi:magnesium chelatase family protein
MCSPAEIHRHWKKLGAALLDRIDMRVAVKAADERADRIADDAGGKAGRQSRSGVKSSDRGAAGGGGESFRSSAEMRRRVTAAVGRAGERLAPRGLRRNAELGPAEAEKLIEAGSEAGRALERSADLLGLSGRGRHSLCRIARTIADLAGNEEIRREHVLEAAEYRRYGDGDYCWVDE